MVQDTQIKVTKYKNVELAKMINNNIPVLKHIVFSLGSIVKKVKATCTQRERFVI